MYVLNIEGPLSAHDIFEKLRRRIQTTESSVKRTLQRMVKDYGMIETTVAQYTLKSLRAGTPQLAVDPNDRKVGTRPMNLYISKLSVRDLFDREFEAILDSAFGGDPAALVKYVMEKSVFTPGTLTDIRDYVGAFKV